MKMYPTSALVRTRKVWLWALLAIVGTSVFAGGSLFVFTADGPAPVRWDDRMLPATFVLSSDGYPGSSITTTELGNELSAAIAQYNAIPEASIQLSFGGEVDVNNSGGESVLGAGIDGINLITFNDPDLSFGAGVAAICAQTITATELIVDDTNNDLNGDGVADLPNGTYPPGTVLDADIVFNGDMALDISGTNGTADVRALGLHEIGHCVGLSHSSIRDAVMFPFQSNDVASARLLKDDDIAHLADKYRQLPEYDSQYGAIEGRVTSGVSGRPVVGAHVYVADTVTRAQIIGAYTGVDGSYRIPVRVGSYFVGVEPLDGDPIGLDPERINTIIADTTDTFFPEEFYDSAESSTDVASDAAIVPVSAALSTTGINITTNTLDVLSSSLLIGRGVNYLSYPVSVPAGISAFDMLTALAQTSQVQSIQQLNSQTGQFETAHLVDGLVRGYDFPIVRSTGLIVHTGADEQLNFRGGPDCPAFDLVAGSNLIAAPCAPAGYSAYDLLQDIGTALDVSRVQSYDRDTDTWLEAQYAGPDPAGVDFAVVDGGAYLVDMNVAVDGFRINRGSAEFPPLLLSISPGEAVAGSIVTLKGTGFAEDQNQNVVLFNDVAAEILEGSTQQLIVRVPLSAASGSVQVISSGLAGNALPFVVLPVNVVEVEGVINDIASGQGVAGNLSDVNDVDDYRFLAIEGNRITARVVTATPGVPEIVATLLNPLGGALTAASNGNGRTAVIRDFVAPISGFYTINIRALSGSGPYTLELTIEGTAGEPRLIAIQGDYQTGVMGTELPVPLQIVAVDETGLPASGVPISFAVTPRGQQNASGIASLTQSTDATRAMASGDMTTLTSGLLTVVVQLPDQVTGDFEITVTAPFRTSKPVTLLVSSIPEAIASVEQTPASEYACADGTGCPVGEVVDIPYELIFRNSAGDPIEDVLVEWAVTSGGGSIEGAADNDGTVSRDRTDSNGRVAVMHRVGERVNFSPIARNDDPTTDAFDPFQQRIRLPQQVVATVPGQPLPAVFTVRAKAGEANIVRSLRSQNQRVSVGSAKFGAVAIFVADQFGNPVANQLVNVTNLMPGVVEAPGFLNGTIFNNPRTDSNGLWSGGLAVLTDGSLAEPSIDEFGEVRRPPYDIDYSVGPVNFQYKVDIDMGPFAFANGIGIQALIGRPITDTLSLTVRRFQRVDQDLIDDDGRWDDEDYSELIAWRLDDLPVTTSIRRVDGNTLNMELSGIPTTLIDGQKIVQNTTDTAGVVTFDNVTVGGVFGGINLISDIGTQTLQFFQGELILTVPFRTATFTFDQSVVPIFARPVILTVNLEDPVPGDPTAPRTHPGIGLSSGIKISELLLRVNDDLITFSAEPFFPFFASRTFDGQGVSLISGAGEDLRPGTVQMVFYPTSDMLKSGEPNEVIISQFSDDVGHIGVAEDPAQDADSSPDTITFEFDYP